MNTRFRPIILKMQFFDMVVMNIFRELLTFFTLVAKKVECSDQSITSESAVKLIIIKLKKKRKKNEKLVSCV